MNYWEKSLGANALLVAYESMVAFHEGLVGYWVEDMIYGDLNQSYGQHGILHLLWNNWGWYVGNFITFPACYGLQWYFTGELFRDKLFSMLTNLSDLKGLMLPFEWKPVNLMVLRNYSESHGPGINQAEQVYGRVLFVIATIIFSHVGLYYEVGRW